MDQYTHPFLAAGSHTEPWNIAGYVFVAAGVGLLAYVGVTKAAGRYRDWRDKEPDDQLLAREFGAALADPENTRLLRIAATLDPYVVEIETDTVLIRLAGIDAPAPAGPWTADEADDRVRSAARERLADADAASRHPFIAIGTRGQTLVFIDPTQSPGAISVEGDQDAVTRLVEVLQRQSDALGHAVRFAAGSAQGAQWRWTLSADGELDTGVLGVLVQTAQLPMALASRDAPAAPPAAARPDSSDAAQRPDATKAKAGTAARPGSPTAASPAAASSTAAASTAAAPTDGSQLPASQRPTVNLLDRLETARPNQPRPDATPAAAQPSPSSKALLVAQAEPQHDRDAVSAADPAAGTNTDLD
ncbi:hypothetical protein KGQ20_40290 [Catenulispora sp. NF23]|uniref:hypothetical protein n=1 Tax=Catenulispora pinistramenti TaxID=2705254 RepID=UPI001BA63BB2|nr:hypothetical protein [Catenulispora pinistramenti]MBS2539006.1 hypothetical protein [Catenulispora pinistramenti]